MNKNAVIYARYSSQGQNEQSIEGQIRICTEYAEKIKATPLLKPIKTKPARKRTTTAPTFRK